LLPPLQAICYYGLTLSSSTSLDNRCMEAPNLETKAARRKRKLNALVAEHGLEALASKSGLSKDYLTQVIRGYTSSFEQKGGSRSERALGDRACRAIETRYNLGAGWFDTDDEQMLTEPERELLAIWRQLPGPARDAMLEKLNEYRARQKAISERLLESLRAPLIGGPAQEPQGRVPGISGFGDLDEEKQAK
jgi:hypothetical protein